MSDLSDRLDEFTKCPSCGGQRVSRRQLRLELRRLASIDPEFLLGLIRWWYAQPRRLGSSQRSREKASASQIAKSRAFDRLMEEAG